MHRTFWATTKEENKMQKPKKKKIVLSILVNSHVQEFWVVARSNSLLLCFAYSVPTYLVPSIVFLYRVDVRSDCGGDGCFIQTLAVSSFSKRWMYTRKIQMDAYNGLASIQKYPTMQEKREINNKTLAKKIVRKVKKQTWERNNKPAEDEKKTHPHTPNKKLYLN